MAYSNNDNRLNGNSTKEVSPVRSNDPRIMSPNMLLKKTYEGDKRASQYFRQQHAAFVQETVNHHLEKNSTIINTGTSRDNLLVHAIESAVINSFETALEQAGNRKLPLSHFKSLFLREANRQVETVLKLQNATLSTTSAPDHDLMEKETAELLQTALADLSARQRKAVYQRFWHNDTYEKVGKDIGLTRKTATHIIDTALAKMRRDIDKAEAGPAINWRERLSPSETANGQKR